MAGTAFIRVTGWKDISSRAATQAAVLQCARVNLHRTPRSLALRTLRRRIRRVWRQPLAGLVGREPETIVRVPPLDPPFLAALKLIAPQYGSLGPDEPS